MSEPLVRRREILRHEVLAQLGEPIRESPVLNASLYTSSPRNGDALIFGHYEGSDLMYAARTRNGFTPASREQLFQKFRGLEISRAHL